MVCTCRRAGIATLELLDDGTTRWVETVVLCELCRRHIEIGKLVEAMPEDTSLCRVDSDTWEFARNICPLNSRAEFGKTPLEALTKGKKT